MSSAKEDEARKEVNEAISNTSSSNMNRMLDAAKSSREKREQSKREREAREAAIRERENTVSERISSMKIKTDGVGPREPENNTLHGRPSSTECAF
jgi:hypothetical protein